MEAPLDNESILAIIFVLGVPSLALATHLVLRPLVREVANAIRTTREGEGRELEHRVTRLEDAIQDLDRQMTRLTEAERFRRELETGRSPPGSERRS